MAKFKSDKKEVKITFRVSQFDNLILETFLEKNKLQNKSEVIRNILFKYILR